MPFDDNQAEEFPFALNQLQQSTHPNKILLPCFKPHADQREILEQNHSIHRPARI